MDMQSRNQYLKKLRNEYLKTKSKKRKGELLDEAQKRTGLNRKYLMEKLRSKSNIDNRTELRKKRKTKYGHDVAAALVFMWHAFNMPCGQRLKECIEQEMDRMRTREELLCSDEVADKLKQISPATIDRRLRRQKEVERDQLKYMRSDRINPLLYHKIPVKIFSEQNRLIIGNIQIDLVEHCGQSAAGEYAYTLVCTDICTGWTEQEAVLGKARERIHKALDRARKRFPYAWKAVHSDNGKEFINAQLYRYAVGSGLDFSRSRPYRKNDNALAEQKNWTHVRRMIGYLRYDTQKEADLLNDLYRNTMGPYKNFFQPVMKLKEKRRVGAKQHRRYDRPATPYRKTIESEEISEEEKDGVRAVYESLSPLELKSELDKKFKAIQKAYQDKNSSQKVGLSKELKPHFGQKIYEGIKPISVR